MFYTIKIKKIFPFPTPKISRIHTVCTVLGRLELPEGTVRGENKFTELPVSLQELFQDKRFIPIKPFPVWLLNWFVHGFWWSETPMTPL